tara:strand:- start:575 stop:799 length:225 start_codon:yes stop_codon:yes gene_type:complete
MSENKSGYQLRADMLGMATGIVVDRTNRLEQNEHFLADNARENDKAYQRKEIAPYTAEEIIAEAEKLYAFVQTK